MRDYLEQWVWPSIAHREGVSGATARWAFYRILHVLDVRIHAVAQSPPKRGDTHARLWRTLPAAVVKANASERLRRSALIVAWGTNGALRKSEAKDLASYEVRARGMRAARLRPCAGAYSPSPTCS